MPFVLKKILSGYIQPSSMILFLVLLGLCAALANKQKRIRLFLLSAAFILCAVSLYSWIPNSLLYRLERRYPPYIRTEPQPHWMLVLGRGFSGEDGIPDSSRIGGIMHARLSEAAYIMRDSSDMKMVVSIAGPDTPLLKRQWWESWCKSVNLPVERTIVMTDAVDTWSEIKEAMIHIDTEPFILVTSAAHMPRSMWMAKEAGGHPLAAPCDYKILHSQTSYGAFIPSARNMDKLEQALHEYIGMAWYRIFKIYTEVSS